MEAVMIVHAREKTLKAFPLPRRREIQARSKRIRASWTAEERAWRVVLAAHKRAELAPILFQSRCG
jgi:hypothetical protein